MPETCAEFMAVFATSGDDLATALSALPSLAGHSVAVMLQDTGASRRYTITFPRSLGENVTLLLCFFLRSLVVERVSDRLLQHFEDFVTVVGMHICKTWVILS